MSVTTGTSVSTTSETCCGPSGDKKVKSMVAPDIIALGCIVYAVVVTVVSDGSLKASISSV